MSKKIEFFYLGPPKSASTWLFRCLRDHPAIATSDHDEISYFNMNYHRGEEWLSSQFVHNADGIRIDCTPTYICDLNALKRIRDYNPEAKLCFGLRHPVDRAFSYYWHMKRKGMTELDFDVSFTNYVAFRLWVDTSQMADQIEFLLQNFKRDQIMFFMFDDLKTRKLEVIQDIYRFIGIDDKFVPESLNKKINVAGPPQDILHKIWYRVLKISGLDQSKLSNMREYQTGPSEGMKKELLSFYAQDIARIETMLDINLSEWKKG